MLEVGLSMPSATVWPVEKQRKNSSQEQLGASRELDTTADPILLARVAGRDRVAFRVLHRRHSGKVRGYLRRVCRDPEVAEDLLQEVFLGIWRQAGGYCPDRGAVGAWIFGVVRNKIFDARRRGKLALSSMDETVENLEAPPDSRRDLRLALYQALETLPESQRQAVSMTYIGGFTYDETAARLAVPLGTLKSRLRAGLKHLRDCLGVSLT